MPRKKPKGLTVTVSGPALFVQVPTGRALDLHKFLRSHGVTASPPSPCDNDTDSIELGRRSDVKAIQDLLDQWSERHRS